jgi:hypothetical protein
MKKLRSLLTLALAASCLALPLALPAPAGASGSYTARPPQPGASGIADRARYALGQRIFNGEVEADASAEAAPQAERLARLQGALPGDVAARKDLPAMAGKLTADQLEALEYFVHERYGR